MLPSQGCNSLARHNVSQKKSTQRPTVGIVNLGCARNLVDSQLILERFKDQNYSIVDGSEADVVVVNTCGFIEDAKKESIDVILDLIELKRQGRIKKLIVAGCLVERYPKELANEFKEVDTFDGVLPLDKKIFPKKVFLTPAHYAYVKICESCFNQCSFCTIPQIKGKFTSRPMGSILKEIKFLDDRGVKEVNLIGQDISAYGLDLYRKMSLALLLKEMILLTKNIQWIRLFYTFPSHVTDALIDVMAQEPKICHYLDLPLQHVSDKILRSMNRGITKKKTLELIEKIRKKIPDIHLRTTLIVGFPGETEKDFQQLVDFVKKVRLERLGVFKYSREEGTAAARLKGQIPEDIKQYRYDVLMQEQQKIAASVQEKFLGKNLIVLIDEKQKGKDNVYLGRTAYDGPEVDGVVYVHSSKKLWPGSFVNVQVTDAYEYDLVGEVAESKGDRD